MSRYNLSIDNEVFSGDTPSHALLSFVNYMEEKYPLKIRGLIGRKCDENNGKILLIRDDSLEQTSIPGVGIDSSLMDDECIVFTKQILNWCVNYDYPEVSIDYLPDDTSMIYVDLADDTFSQSKPVNKGDNDTQTETNEFNTKQEKEIQGNSSWIHPIHRIDDMMSLKREYGDFTLAQCVGLFPEAYDRLPLQIDTFSTRLCNVLVNELKIKYYGELLRIKCKILYKTPNIGLVSVNELFGLLENLPKMKLEPIPDDSYTYAFSAAFFSFIQEHIELIESEQWESLNRLSNESGYAKAVENLRKLAEEVGTDMVEYCISTRTGLSIAYSTINSFTQSMSYHIDNVEKARSLLDVIPVEQRLLRVGPLLNAYKQGEKTDSLRIYWSDLDASLDEVNVIISDSSFERFLSLCDFLKWCAASLSQACEEMYDVLASDRIDQIISIRADGGSLQQAGDVIGVSRERIRQIEIKICSSIGKIERKYSVVLHIAALLDGAEVLSENELQSYLGQKSHLIYYLLCRCQSSSFTYNKKLDVIVVGDDNVNENVQKYVEALPDQLSEKDKIRVIQRAIEEENLPEELIRQEIEATYEKKGTFWHRGRLTLNQIYSDVLNRYYPQGFHYADEQFIQDFRKQVIQEYGNVSGLDSNDHAIINILQRNSILRDKGYYIPKNNKKTYISEPLAQRIYDHIKNGSESVYLIRHIYERFQTELESEGIDNHYYLQGILSGLYGDELFFRRDYVSKNPDITSLYSLIEEYICHSRKPVLNKIIYETIKGSKDVFYNFLETKSDIISYGNSVLYKGQLHLSEDDYEVLRNAINTILQDGKVHRADEIWNLLSQDGQENLLEKMYVQDSSNLLSVIRALFQCEYTFYHQSVALRGSDGEEEITRNRAERARNKGSLNSISNPDYRKQIYEMIEAAGVNGVSIDDIDSNLHAPKHYVDEIISSNSIIRFGDNLVSTDAFCDLSNAKDDLLSILENQFAKDDVVTSKELWKQAVFHMEMFLDDNGLDEQKVFWLTQHLFSQECYRGHKYYFYYGDRITQRNFPGGISNRTILLQYIKKRHEPVSYEELQDRMKELSLYSVNVKSLLNLGKQEEVLLYKPDLYILAEWIPVNEILPKIKTILTRILNEGYEAYPMFALSKEDLTALPLLPMGLSWTTQLIHELVFFHPMETGFRIIPVSEGTNYNQIGAGFTKIDSMINTFPELVLYCLHQSRYKKHSFTYNTDSANIS